jgi:hypothetical protein
MPIRTFPQSSEFKYDEPRLAEPWSGHLPCRRPGPVARQPPYVNRWQLDDRRARASSSAVRRTTETDHEANGAGPEGDFASSFPSSPWKGDDLARPMA